VVDAVKIDWVARIICDEYLLEKGLVYDTVRLICEAKEYRIAQQIAKLVINITSEKISPSDVIAIAEIISKSKGGYQAECATPTAIEAILYAPIETVKELVTIISQADDSYQSDVASCAASLISEPFIQVKNHDKDINVVDLVKLVSKCVGARHAEHVFDIIVSLKHGEYSNIEWKDILELVKIIGQAKTNYQTDYAFSMAENYILIASDLYLKMAKLASKMKNGEQIKIEEAELENIISAVDIASEEEVTDYEKAALYNLFDITENFWDAFVTDPDRAIELLESTYSDRDYDVSEDTRIKVRRKTSEE